MTISLGKAEADASTRDNNGWRAAVGTLKDASIEFTVPYKSGDVQQSQALLRTASPIPVQRSLR